MNIILLSGGSGKRLWPLSNELRSKQFLKLLKDKAGRPESMVQRVYRQLKEVGLANNIVIATSAAQEDALRDQLGDGVDIVLEPERSNTYPAIALASSFLKTERGCSDEDVVVVLPVDPYVELGYFLTLKKMEAVVKAGAAEMVLMGIEPTLATSKYGYILPEEEVKNGYELVAQFIEKPDEEKAKKLIEKGAVWNGGVFAYRLGYMEKVLRERGFPMDYIALRDQYSNMRKISFDYEVVETASSVAVVRYHGNWKDLGTWNTLTDEMTTSLTGAVLVGEGTENTNVINETNIPVVVLGAKNMVVVAGPDGNLVTGKEESAELRTKVDKIDTGPRYEEHSWGDYEILDCADYNGEGINIVRRVHLLAGKKLNYPGDAQEKSVVILGGNGILHAQTGEKNVAAGCLFQISGKDSTCLEAVSEMYYIETWRLPAKT